jgi:outer membrane murein-binding lipoprotein Lpp
LRVDVNGLRTNVDELRVDVNGLRADVDELRVDVNGLRVDVGGLSTTVSGLRTDVAGLTGRVGALEEDVRKLRVLGEENTQQIKLIAEVQSHHGTVLEQLLKDVEPLKVVPDLLRTVIQNHEQRITALETRGEVRG